MIEKLWNQYIEALQEDFYNTVFQTFLLALLGSAALMVFVVACWVIKSL